MSEPVFEKEVLENGLTILTEQIDHLRSISFGVWLKKGSQDESSDDAGIYHFIEHMLFKGTETKNAYEIAKIIDSIGGVTDAFTSKEHTCFYAKVLDEHLPIILELFSDILIRPKFDPDDIERERKVIHEEIKMVEDNPSDLVHELFLEHFWQSHPLGRPILGTVDTVNAVDQNLLWTRFSRSYVPENMVITAVGKLHHNDLVQSIREYFRLDHPGNGLKKLDIGEVKPNPVIMVRPKHELEQAHVCIGMMAYSANHPGRYAENVLNVILGGSMSSRLFQKLREERGLCYTVFSSLSPFLNSGYICLYAATAKDTVKTAIELILEECRLLARESVTVEELENAKNHLKGSLMLSLESSSTRMFNLARNDLYHGRQISPAETLDRISAVTLDDVQRVAMELFLNHNYGIVVVGDVDDFELHLKDFPTH